jgi:ectoine hydroxylase-related dioxygenase (phytanoyl-CoA dioxygenase family)
MDSRRSTAPVPQPASGVFSRRHEVAGSDLAQRLAALGLERHAVELQLRGYTVVENAASAEFFAELRARILECVAQTPEGEGGFPGARTPLSFRTAGMLLERGRIFEIAVCNPRLLALAEFMTGQGFIVCQVLGSVKEQGMGEIGLHSDYNFVREPFPAYPLLVTSLFACEDLTAEAGCPRVVPGSHRWQRHPSPGEGEEAAVPVECPRGSFVMWDGALWHDNRMRTLPGERVCLHVTFNRMLLRPFEQYALPREIIERNPPEFARLLGLEDPLGKSTWYGPDRERTALALTRYRS